MFNMGNHHTIFSENICFLSNLSETYILFIIGKDIEKKKRYYKYILTYNFKDILQRKRKIRQEREKARKGSQRKEALFLLRA